MRADRGQADTLMTVFGDPSAGEVKTVKTRFPLNMKSDLNA